VPFKDLDRDDYYDKDEKAMRLYMEYYENGDMKKFLGEVLFSKMNRI
jgi:hypothetical protein